MEIGVAFAIGISVLSLLISLVDVFKGEIGQRLSGEYLKLTYDASSALCQRTQHDEFEEGFQDCIVLRLRVENTGRRPAEGVRLLLCGLSRSHDGADWTLDESFCPIHLTWMHHGDAVSLPFIAPRSDYLADLGILLPANVTPTAVNHTYEPDRFPSPESTLQLFTQLSPMNNSSFLRPGWYRFDFQLVTDRGIRGAGEITVGFGPEADVTRSATDQISVSVERDAAVAGRRLLQREL